MRFSTSVELKTIVGGKVNGTYSDGFTQSSTNSNGLQASLKFNLSVWCCWFNINTRSPMDNAVYFRSIPMIGRVVFEIFGFIFLQKSFLEANNGGI